jgi:hypothetical protein
MDIVGRAHGYTAIRQYLHMKGQKHNISCYKSGGTEVESRRTDYPLREPNLSTREKLEFMSFYFTCLEPKFYADRYHVIENKQKDILEINHIGDFV